MSTLIIKSNAATTQDVLIRDMGIVIPQAGGSETFVDQENLARAARSKSLVTLATDDAFGAGSSTLILNDGINDIDQAVVSTFITSVDLEPPEELVEQMSTGRVVFGGLTDLGGRDIRVLAGRGYVKEGPPDQLAPAVVIPVQWIQTDITVPASTARAIVVTKTGTVQLNPSTAVDVETEIVLGIVITDASDITFLSSVDVDVIHKIPDRFQYLRDTIGALSASGNAVTVHSPPSLQLAVDSGTYYIAEDRKTHPGTAPITFRYWYRDGSGGFITVGGQTGLDSANYDDGSGTLAALGIGEFKKDLLVLAPSGNSSVEFHVIYGQETFLTQVAAENGDIPQSPSDFAQWAMRIAAPVVEQGATDIASIVDVRPRLGQLAPPTTSVTDHGLLSGLSDDDHGQYQLRSEKGAANGYPSLGAGGKIPIGEIATAAPGAIGVGTASAEGVATTTARSDHVHQSNTSPSDVTKAAATIGTSGEPARADHKHDVSTAAAVANPPGTANAEGSSSSLARSDHAHALAAFGTGAGTFCEGNDPRLSDKRTADALATTGADVNVGASAPPATGQVLKATGATTATWQNLDELPIADTTPLVKGSADPTKLLRLEVDGLTTGTTRVITVPDKDVEIDDKADARPPKYDSISSFPEVTSTSPTYEFAARFIFGGSTDLGIPTAIKIVGGINGTATGDFRIQDVTNANTIAEITGISAANPAILDMGVLSNISAGEAIWELQLLRASGTGGNVPAVSAVSLIF